MLNIISLPTNISLTKRTSRNSFSLYLKDKYSFSKILEIRNLEKGSYSTFIVESSVSVQEFLQFQIIDFSYCLNQDCKFVYFTTVSNTAFCIKFLDFLILENLKTKEKYKIHEFLTLPSGKLRLVVSAINLSDEKFILNLAIKEIK